MRTNSAVRNSYAFARISLCIASVCLALTACSEPRQAFEKQHAAAPTYYSSEIEADAALADFERNNPSCQLWTNWQKMCSRTGRSGSTSCIESVHKAMPSEPFCVARTNRPYEGVLPSDSNAQRLSFNRFCEEFSNDQDQAKVCVRWVQERPFSGLNIKDRLHPWCAEWQKALDPSVNLMASERLGFRCDYPSVPEWCEWVEGLGANPAENPSGLKIPVGPLDPQSRAIIGIYCRRKTSYAEE